MKGYVVDIAGLTELAGRFRLVAAPIINISLLCIKLGQALIYAQFFVCSVRRPIAGLVSSIGSLRLDLVVR